MKTKQEKNLRVLLIVAFVVFLLCAAGILIEPTSLAAVIVGNVLVMGTALGLFYSTLHLQRNP